MTQNTIKKLSLSELMLLRMDFVICSKSKGTLAAPITVEEFDLLTKELSYRLKTGSLKG